MLSIIPSYLKKSVDEERANEDTNFRCETRRYLSWIEGLTTNQYVGGSNPSRRTIETAGHRGFSSVAFFCFHGLILSRGCYLGAKRRPSNPLFSGHCGRFRALTGKNRVVCILFLLNAFRLPLSWQNSFEMYAFRLNDGKILAPCMHFQMQLGNSEYIAQESCRQRLHFTSGASKSCMLYDSCHGGLVPEVRARYVPLRSPLSIG